MKFICIGRNYVDHIKELQNTTPEDPVVFLKPQTALLSDNQNFYYPEFTQNLQYECELIIRIQKNGKYIQEKFASKYYNAISLGIDFTARDLQTKLKEKGLPWEIAKSFDHSAVIGHFVDLNKYKSIQNLNFELKVNGITKQIGNTSKMIFAVDKIIAYVSQFFTLNVGDIIFTGTPSGVGPIQINDHLEAFLENELLLNCTIK